MAAPFGRTVRAPARALYPARMDSGASRTKAMIAPSISFGTQEKERLVIQQSTIRAADS
jgi:hypothetical protein